LRALSLCACCRHYPGTATGGCTSLVPPVVSAFPERVVGSACASSIFEACSAFTHVTACTLAGSPYVIRYIRGFSQFVASLTAPIAYRPERFSRVGFAPTGKAPPYHGAHPLADCPRGFTSTSGRQVRLLTGFLPHGLVESHVLLALPFKPSRAPFGPSANSIGLLRPLLTSVPRSDRLAALSVPFPGHGTDLPR
jgi:hypothetical protein